LFQLLNDTWQANTTPVNETSSERKVDEPPPQEPTFTAASQEKKLLEILEKMRSNEPLTSEPTQILTRAFMEKLSELFAGLFNMTSNLLGAVEDNYEITQDEYNELNRLLNVYLAERNKLSTADQGVWDTCLGKEYAYEKSTLCFMFGREVPRDMKADEVLNDELSVAENMLHFCLLSIFIAFAELWTWKWEELLDTQEDIERYSSLQELKNQQAEQDEDPSLSVSSSPLR